MKSLALLISTASFLAFYSYSPDSTAFGIHKWVEKNGTTVYTDTPPEGKTTQAIELPEITIIESLPIEPRPPISNTSSDETNNTNSNLDSQTQSTNQENNSYEVKILSPKNDEAIRANDGNVTAIFSVQPPLKKGESLVIYLNGKQKSAGENSQFRFENLDRGTHSLFAVVRDKEGNVVANSESTKFHLQRFSALHHSNNQHDDETIDQPQ